MSFMQKHQRVARYSLPQCKYGGVKRGMNDFRMVSKSV
jgi:hypothetical protein